MLGNRYSPGPGMALVDAMENRLLVLLNQAIAALTDLDLALWGS